MRERWHQEIESPVGGLVLVAEAETLVGLYHRNHDPAPEPVRLGYAVHRSGPTPAVAGTGSGSDAQQPVPDTTMAVLDRAALQLGEYFAGARQGFDLPLGLHGSDFQVRVWTDLLKIPYGERRSYRDLAEREGNPAMGRAIGAAVRANPVSIIVPGHRVVSSSDRLVGYASGIGTKSALLEHEAGTRSLVGTVGGAAGRGSQ
ncbi:methylated-DNA--[protein]-cysteine S-methyltransferase [Arthrobacter echini]|uniref:methylated-DNA--[protein]-cysteine S-methyltransferase n=2 Tax=Arthrobacter echini TaxID=1529066 RepID=A0A4S5E6G6_9MICC|nr:methylated-DNA--[protein]-cysteine S-methyltransferase [Arthrobacter echini]